MDIIDILKEVKWTVISVFNHILKEHFHGCF